MIPVIGMLFELVNYPPPAPEPLNLKPQTRTPKHQSESGSVADTAYLLLLFFITIKPSVE